MRKILIVITALLVMTCCAAAQSVKQTGRITPGHATCWTTSGVVQDCGVATIPFLTSIGTVGQGSTICANSAANTGPYTQLCLGATTGSPYQVIMQSLGGAASQPLQFIVNGTTYSFPFTGPGTGIVGPVSSTNGGQICWDNTSGTLAKDCPITPHVVSAGGTVNIGNSDTGDFLVTTNSAVTFNFPSAALRSGVPVSVVALTGSTPNITLVPFSGQTLLGQSSLTITNSYAAFTLWPYGATGLWYEK